MGRRPPLRRIGLDSMGSLLLTRLLGRLEQGTLAIELPSGATVEFRGADCGLESRLTLYRWRALGRLMRKGDLGFAESYMAGDWSTANLATLLELLLRNETALEPAWQGLSGARLASRLRHRARANSLRGSRRNIEAHYDLGNAFYASWLDRDMNYSSALYADPGLTLEQAQIAKLDRAIALLGAKPSDHVLEIGCGWGALAERLAVHQGCRVTGITLSNEQLTFARERLRRSGVGERATIRLQDYRTVHEKFDAIISIEMLEAAGEAYWPMFFRKLHDSLVPGGRAVLQVITIEESRFDDYRSRPDFIQRYIFPGGLLPTNTAILRQLSATGLKLHLVERFSASYARTLAEWRARFSRANATPAEALRDADSFRRMWNYYLAYCEAGFRTGALDVALYQISREL
ncbi:MAG: class I SAM-dependent methyltransferase [Alphaproteobacteria bacterium]|nr:class I SAM-dependent methyltransferase [Alphaproteobacteria bacterium]